MPRILLAEDDDSLRGFLARALERAGYEVTACADGEEAAAVLGESWDLLLTDIVMPGMDGIEVARLAAARSPPATAPRRAPRCSPSPSTCARSSPRWNG